MGLFKRRAPPEAQLSKEGVKEGEKSDVLAEQKVTLIACVLGAVASLGGFIFGYVRYAHPVALCCQGQLALFGQGHWSRC